MSQKLPVSVQICTLNEEHNIEACLAKVLLNNPEEIIVIDGGSDDKTVSLAAAFGAKIINAGRIGLAKQRQLGIESTMSQFIGIVDADDRLQPDCLVTLLSQMKNEGYQAIQANVQSFSNTSYWQKAWGLFCSVNINSAGKTNIVGRPAIFERESILKVGFDPFFTYGSEDTDISYRFEKAGLSQGIGTGVSFRIHPHTFGECKRKWISYGKGYARFAFKHPERRKSIIHHMIFNIPIKRSIRVIKEGFYKYIPFNLLYSCFCALGYWKEASDIKKNELKQDFGR